LNKECTNTFEVRVTGTKKYCCSKCANRGENNPKGMLGKHHIKEAKKKDSDSVKRLWQRLEYRIKQARSRVKTKQNRAEKLLEKILDNSFLINISL